MQLAECMQVLCLCMTHSIGCSWNGASHAEQEGPGGEMSREHKEWLASVLSRWSETDSPHLDGTARHPPVLLLVP